MGLRSTRPPSGIVTERIDPESGQLAGPRCPESRTEYFIAGSEPQSYLPSAREQRGG